MYRLDVFFIHFRWQEILVRVLDSSSLKLVRTQLSVYIMKDLLRSIIGL